MRWTIQHYIRFLRRQHVNIQHLHMIVFSSIITTLIAFFVLYFEYGFFHTTYDKEKVVYEEKKENKDSQIESPSVMFSNLFKESKKRFSDIGTSTFDFLSSKEVYVKH